MDELTSVNAEQASDEGSQVIGQETVESVNAEESEVTTTETEKPVQTPEENAHFAEQRRAREQAEQRAATVERDYSISRTYGADWGVHSEADIAEKYAHLGITTLDQFQTAVKEYEMKQKGLDPNLINEYVNEHPAVKAAKVKEREDADLIAFFKANPTVKAEDITPELWQEFKSGKSLLDVYTKHENQQLKAKLAEYEGRQKAEETNTANAESTTGSLTGNGNGKNVTLTPEIINSMTDKERMARWPEIKKVLGMK